MHTRPSHPLTIIVTQDKNIVIRYDSRSIQDVMVILVCVKNEEDPIKIEGTRVATIQNSDFSNTKGQLTPQSEVGSG